MHIGILIELFNIQLCVGFLSCFLGFFLVVVWFVFFPHTTLSHSEYLSNKITSLTNQAIEQIFYLTFYTKTACFYSNRFNFCLKKPVAQTPFIEIHKTIKSCENTTAVKLYLQIPECLFLLALFWALLLLQERA